MCKHEDAHLIRTQVQLTEEQAASLKRAAARRGVSMAELIRQALEKLLSAEDAVVAARRARALAAIGRFRSNESDVARRHDDYLDEAYGTWRPRVR